MHSQVKTKNILIYSALVLACCLQLVIILGLISSFIPFKLNDFVHTLLPLYWDQVRPHRQMPIFAAFILTGILLQAGGMIFLKKQLQDDSFARRWSGLVGMQYVWLLMEIIAIFKFFVFGQPAWARWLLYLSLAGCALNTIFWPECKRWWDEKSQGFIERTARAVQCWWLDGVLVGGIMVLLWPDMTKLLAHVFVWDNFDNLDAFLMFPGWAYLQGQTINIDVNSNYSAVSPPLLSLLIHYTGGFSYEHAMRVIIVMSLAYYTAVWALLRHWLKSALVAFLGFLLVVKFQMFHWGILPVLWRYPSATPVRYLFDVLAIFFVYKHITSGRERYLWLASSVTGLMLAYQMEVGIYLTLGLYAYILMLIMLKGMRDVRKILLVSLLPWVVGLMVLWMVQGRWVWTAEFWQNATEFQRLFLNGFGALPYWDGLRDRQFFAFAMGFIIPAVYVLTLMLTGARLFFRQASSIEMFVVYLCVYGLGIYHYFVYRSAVTSYHVVCIPFVLILCFWIHQAVQLLHSSWRRIILIVLTAGTLLSLLTAYLFTAYPNGLNLARLDYSQEIAFYKKEFNFQQDVQLISRLTKADEPVALISSYETKMLMEAKRKSFFYYFPMVWSEPMGVLDFKGTEILTVQRMQKTLQQMENQKPTYVFIEKKLFLGQLSPAHYQHYQTLTILIQYLNQRYESAQEGQYLLALRRK